MVHQFLEVASCELPGPHISAISPISEDPSIVGHIIGPGGANLRHIYDTTGCKIKFVQALASHLDLAEVLLVVMGCV